MAKKKIFDITPSHKEFKESPKELTERKPITLRVRASAKAPRLESVAVSPKPASVVRKIIPFFMGIVLLAGGVSGYFLIPHKVKLDVWPKQTILDETLTATVGTLSQNGRRIAGEIVKEEKTASQAFPATGAKFKSVKARGNIRVYNGYSTASQVLVATTRFVSSDGRLFRTPIKVVIPGGYYDGGKLVPGFVDIEVVADQPGEEYNIDPSAFSIPGFAGTPKYTAFYAKSSEPMKGGLEKEVKQVTQSDLDKAKEILTGKAKSENTASFKNSFSSKGYIIFDQAIISNSADFTVGVRAGDEAESFTAQSKATIQALIFKDSDLKNFAKNYIKGKILPEEELIENAFKADYVLESVNLEKQELSLKLSISAKSYSAPEPIRIKEMIRGKNADEVENIFGGLAWLERAKADFWPFWVGLAPEDLERIEVVVHLD